MRTVKYTGRFKRDYRRDKSGVLGRRLDALLMEVVDLLAADKPLLRTWITSGPANGGITGTAISGLISC
jgi:hypothetical protein